MYDEKEIEILFIKILKVFPNIQLKVGTESALKYVLIVGKIDKVTYTYNYNLSKKMHSCMRLISF